MALRTVRWILMGATFFSVPTPSAHADEPSIQFVQSYAGPHPAEFRDLLAEVKTILPSALCYITGQWGLPNTLRSPMIVRVTDDNTLGNLPGRPVSAYVRSYRAGGILRQELVVDLTHHLMYPTENLENVLYHEMAHAILQDAITGPTTAGIPQWFNEGLAQSVTTEGRERTQEDFKRFGHTADADAHAVVCDLNGHVDEFYHGEYNFGCYTYFYLTVERLSALGGKDALPRLIIGLRNGTPLPQLIGQVLPMNWTTFQANAAQYALDVFSGKEPTP